MLCDDIWERGELFPLRESHNTLLELHSACAALWFILSQHRMWPEVVLRPFTHSLNYFCLHIILTDVHENPVSHWCCSFLQVSLIFSHIMNLSLSLSLFPFLWFFFTFSGFHLFFVYECFHFFFLFLYVCMYVCMYTYTYVCVSTCGGQKKALYTLELK